MPPETTKIRRHTLHARAFICVISCLAFAVDTPHAASADDATAPPVEKLPIPKGPAQSKADHELREKLKADFDKHDAGDDLALAQRLDVQSKSTDDPAMRFVLLREARELYIDGGDLDSALQVIESVGAIFAIDVRDMKLSALAVAVDKALIEPPALCSEYLKLGDRFLDEGDVDLAEHACRLAQNVIHNHHLRDPDRESRVKEQHRTVLITLKETQAVVGAMRKLKANPDDPEASLTVGKYACFFRGLWTENLPLLAKGSDSRLKILAEREIASPSDPEAMASIADDWWELAQSATTPIARRHIQIHAAEWYKKALLGLSEARKQVAQQRIADAAR